MLFLSFTGTPGTFVKIEDTIRGFKEILEGKHDDVPERAFFMKGTIEEVVEEAGGSSSDEDSASKDSESQGAESKGSDDSDSESGAKRSDDDEDGGEE